MEDIINLGEDKMIILRIDTKIIIIVIYNNRE